jgi:LPS sulfotransferase NodH
LSIDRKEKNVPVITSLYGREFDYPSFLTEPATQFMVATMPRSGSTFFCIELWKTGVLGAPLEYANFVASKAIIKRLSPDDEKSEHWEKVKCLRTSPNGVFGYKMFTSNLMHIARSHPRLLKKITPDHVVYLTREDKLGQAISYSKAIRSRSWFADVAVKAPLDYDAQHIKQCERMLQRQEQFWESLFARTRTDVLRVTYEQMMADPVKVANAVANFVGVATSPLERLDIPALSTQRDNTSAEWRTRYLSKGDAQADTESSDSVAWGYELSVSQ